MKESKHEERDGFDSKGYGGDYDEEIGGGGVKEEKVQMEREQKVGGDLGGTGRNLSVTVRAVVSDCAVIVLFFLFLSDRRRKRFPFFYVFIMICSC